MTPYRIGVDIGGTFTDFVLVDEAIGTMRFAKELTSPHDPSEAVLAFRGDERDTQDDFPDGKNPARTTIEARLTRRGREMCEIRY